MIIPFLVIFTTLLSCKTNQLKMNKENTAKDEKILISKGQTILEYKEAVNYFVRNDYKEQELHYVKIKSELELDKIMGMGASMGKDGMPTKIDFSKSYLIALIGKTNDSGANFEISNLVKEGDKITVNIFDDYNKQLTGEKLSYSIRPSRLLIVDNKHQGSIKIEFVKRN